MLALGAQTYRPDQSARQTGLFYAVKGDQMEQQKKSALTAAHPSNRADTGY